MEHDGKCITVFSAPNYCDQMGNRGAFIKFSGDFHLHLPSTDSLLGQEPSSHTQPYHDHLLTFLSLSALVTEDLEPRFTQFEAAPHPPIRPMAYASNLMGL